MNTMQQEFDAVVAHLYKQNRPARDNNRSACLYRFTESDGTMLTCAVGCRIPDASYVADMDIPHGDGGTGLYNLLKNYGTTLPEELNAYSGMFCELQSVHDTCDVTFNGTFHRSSLNSELARVAVHYSLQFVPQEG